MAESTAHSEIDVLYVITTNLPGPGASGLIRDRIAQMVDEGYEGGITEPLCELVDGGACEFVELEDHHGCSVDNAGVDWTDQIGKGTYKLGPFVSATAVVDYLEGLLAMEGAATIEASIRTCAHDLRVRAGWPR